MSIYPSPDKLDSLESKYALVILAAKRARQIKDNARKLVDTRSTNPLTIALEEIAAGAIVPRIVEDAAVAAHQAALKPNEPSLEDIIGAGPVLAIDSDQDSTAAQLAAFRNAEPESDDDDLSGDDRGLAARVSDGFTLDSPILVNEVDDDEDDLIQSIDDDDD